MTARISRRGFLGAAAAGITTAASHSPAFAGMAATGGLLLLHRDYQSLGRHHVTGPARSFVPLERDVVRQWRTRLAEQIKHAGSATAYTPWAEALILAGLAREAGGEARTERVGRAFVTVMTIKQGGRLA